jgi:hypothetical protein
MTNPYAELRALVRESLTLQNQGATYSKLSRAQGAVDGYMRALLDAGLATNKDLLRLVSDERARINGPSTTSLVPEGAIA